MIRKQLEVELRVAVWVDRIRRMRFVERAVDEIALGRGGAAEDEPFNADLEHCAQQGGRAKDVVTHVFARVRYALTAAVRGCAASHEHLLGHGLLATGLAESDCSS